ncbi:MAG: hypothetical protein COW63_06320 [Bacteroidetes bacterium CG18_big_fil_WC_8_21_14_2_50_41_14]|nr:MAG: hypothetical protein COW63_06320 [Bacteroidetes bacterium CG18_big_fil_WC_8_21_14_2_50_41_14]PJB59710.1 MAG: hypothetical protein CO098_01895 [Bacteroidetes bacterium CG_4_9_14_3_um_filter_41_19]
MKPTNTETKKNFWIIATNSTASYVLAFLFVFYVNHFANILTSGSFGYEVSFDWNTIYYHIEPYEWTHDAVKLIFSAGPMLILLIGLISLIAFYSLVEEPARIKTFFMWLTLHALNYFFGGLLIGNIFKKGVGHVFNWMYFTDTTKMLVALVGFFGLLATAYFMSKPVAISANSYYNKLSEKNFPFFFTAQIIVPFVVGTLLYTLYFLPDLRFQERYSWMSLGVLLIIIFGRVNYMETLYFDEEDRYISLSKVIVLTTLIMVIGLRLILSHEILVSW